MRAHSCFSLGYGILKPQARHCHVELLEGKAGSADYLKAQVAGAWGGWGDDQGLNAALLEGV